MQNELVLIGGYPAGGKTTITKQFADRGYERLNRDVAGGKVDDLLPKLDILLSSGKNVVMDNLYASVASRAGAVKVAQKLKVPVHFVRIDTSLEDAQFNACVRMVQKVGRVLHPDDHKKAPYKDDPNLFPVAVLYKYRKEFEKPSTAEGFTSVRVEQFVRQYPADWVNKAAIFDFDGTLRTHVGNEKFPTKRGEVRAIKDRATKLRQLEKDGYLLLGASNQSGVAKGILTAQDVEDCLDETLKQLDVEFSETLYCPHKVPPITCYCRKPGPGMGVELIMKYKLDPRQCFYVGDQTTDKSFAERCGFKFYNEADFWR